MREAITAANAASGKETITFNIPGAGPHTIQLTSVLPDLSGDVDILNTSGNTSGKSITVRGNGSTGGFRVFHINSGVTVNISNLTISNGYAREGGGIDNVGTLNITNSTISNNSVPTNSGAGGGIYSGGGRINITNSTLSNNSAYQGGGIYVYFSIHLTVTNSTISNNSASFGGGILRDNTTVTLRGASLPTNTATSAFPDFRGAPNSLGYNLIGDNSGANITANTGDQIGTSAAPIDPLL